MNFENYVEANKERFLNELKELLRIPSVSAQPARKHEVRRAAEWLEKHLAEMGLSSELRETNLHPIILAKSSFNPSLPTILFYGHYDVQPEDPVNEWITPPFEPTVRGDNIYARGATDDKGQMFAVVKGVETFLKTRGTPPVNLILLIEGEEEYGTENLEKFIKENTNELKADYAVICDTSQVAKGMPSITYGLRGIATFELKVKGPNSDLHSGLYGGMVQNPLNALVEVLAKLHDEKGRVQLKDFYKDVIELESWERNDWKKLPDIDSTIKKELELDHLFGEEGYTTYERGWARPTCDINGIFGGYTGDGFKTVIGKEAKAKVSFRLVPNQDSKKIESSFKEFLETNLPIGVSFTLENFGSAPAALINAKSEGMEIAKNAVEKGFKAKPYLIRSGGSIPVTSMIKNYLKIDSLLIGLGLPDDNLHAPNEKFHIPDFYNGIKTIAYLIEDMGKLKR